jgi:hypothetical protein
VLQFRNLIYNTTPIVLHSPGYSPVWDSITKIFFSTPRRNLPALKDVTLLTWNSHPTASLLEKSAEHLGIKVIVLGRGIKAWNNTLKIPLTVSAIEKITTPFVMGVDAFDAIITESPDQAISKFLEMDCNILFNSTDGPFPPIKELFDFEISVAPPVNCRHLNAGAWLGKRDACLSFFSYLPKFEKAIAAIDGGRHLIYEQGYVRMGYKKFHPDVAIDYRSEIFQLFRTPDWSLTSEGGGIEGWFLERPKI